MTQRWEIINYPPYNVLATDGRADELAINKIDMQLRLMHRANFILQISKDRIHSRLKRGEKGNKDYRRNKSNSERG